MKPVIHLENLDDMPVAPIMRDVAEMYEPVAEDAGVTLTLGALDDVALHINRELVGQTVSNLVDNAIKYAGGEGRTATVTLLMEKDAQWVRIVVADNGPGIPADKRDHATERFVRLEESRTQPGSGLGLSLAKAVMKLHGGALRLEDNGPGLRAVLEFPLPHREVTARAHPEKCETVFAKDARQNKGLERRSDSIRSKRALNGRY